MEFATCWVSTGQRLSHVLRDADDNASKMGETKHVLEGLVGSGRMLSAPFPTCEIGGQGVVWICQILRQGMLASRFRFRFRHVHRWYRSKIEAYPDVGLRGLDAGSRMKEHEGT